MRKITDVADLRVHLLRELQDIEKRRLGRCLEGIAVDLRTEHPEHETEPAALEAGVPGHEHPLPFIKLL